MGRYSSPLGKFSRPLHDNLAALQGRLKPLNRLGIAHDEFLELFAPPEHWPILKQAAEVADITAARPGAHSATFRAPGLAASSATLYFEVSKDGAPLMPRNKVVLDMAAPKLLEKLTTWANKEIEFSYAFARAKAVLEWLEANCEDRKQIRFLWPPIVSLASLSEFTAELGDRIRDFKTPTRLPAIPTEVKLACRETAGTITSAMLLDAEPPPWSAPVKVSLLASEAARTEGALGLIKA